MQAVKVMTLGWRAYTDRHDPAYLAVKSNPVAVRRLVDGEHGEHLRHVGLQLPPSVLPGQRLAQRLTLLRIEMVDAGIAAALEAPQVQRLARLGLQSGRLQQPPEGCTLRIDVWFLVSECAEAC